MALWWEAAVWSVGGVLEPVVDAGVFSTIEKSESLLGWGAGVDGRANAVRRSPIVGY